MKLLLCSSELRVTEHTAKSEWEIAHILVPLGYKNTMKYSFIHLNTIPEVDLAEVGLSLCKCFTSWLCRYQEKNWTA